MKTVGVRELKQNASQVLARVEQGESFVVTVQGRPVGALTPAPASTWISAERMMAVYDVPTDRTFWDDVDAARGESIQDDPWERGHDE